MGWLSNLHGRHARKKERSPVQAEVPQPSEKAPLAQHSDSLSLLALDPEKRAELLTRVVSEGAWILAITPDSRREAETPDQFVDHVRRQVQESSQDHLGTPYTYLQKGSVVLPLFSTVEASQEFIKRLKVSKMIALQCLQMLAVFWIHTDFGLTRVMFNPFSNCQTEFSEAELRQMRVIATEIVR